MGFGRDLGQEAWVQRPQEESHAGPHVRSMQAPPVLLDAQGVLVRETGALALCHVISAA